MQGCTCEKSYKKINIFLKNKFNLYKIKKKSQRNHIYLFQSIPYVIQEFHFNFLFFNLTISFKKIYVIKG